MTRVPMNGTQTHPLSKTAFAELKGLKNGPFPAQEINPGVVNRLLREDLIELVPMESPYKTRKGKISFAKITEAGIARVEAGFQPK